MSYNARIEELSDSEPEEIPRLTSGAAADDSDPDEMDIEDLNIPQTATILPRAQLPQPTPAQTANIPSAATRQAQEAATRERTKNHQCLYPIYFDSTRSRAEGRRVSKSLAVPNPLARELADACASLGLSVLFEPAKSHPKDWANPGRVRILVKQGGKSVAPGVENSKPAFPQPLWHIVRSGMTLDSHTSATEHHLNRQVAAYLQSHPTDAMSPLKLRIPNLPLPEGGKAPPAPAVPRGWKMGTILPLHSPAVTGGGVSDNMFGEILKGMGAGGAGGGDMAGMAEMMKGMLGGAGGGMGGMGGMGAEAVPAIKGRRAKK